jgi:hypothetical protein
MWMPQKERSSSAPRRSRDGPLATVPGSQLTSSDASTAWLSAAQPSPAPAPHIPFTSPGLSAVTASAPVTESFWTESTDSESSERRAPPPQMSVSLAQPVVGGVATQPTVQLPLGGETLKTWTAAPLAYARSLMVDEDEPIARKAPVPTAAQVAPQPVADEATGETPLWHDMGRSAILPARDFSVADLDRYLAETDKLFASSCLEGTDVNLSAPATLPSSRVPSPVLKVATLLDLPGPVVRDFFDSFSDEASFHQWLENQKRPATVPAPASASALASAPASASASISPDQASFTSLTATPQPAAARPVPVNRPAVSAGSDVDTPILPAQAVASSASMTRSSSSTSLQAASPALETKTMAIKQQTKQRKMVYYPPPSTAVPSSPDLRSSQDIARGSQEIARSRVALQLASQLPDCALTYDDLLPSFSSLKASPAVKKPITTKALTAGLMAEHLNL